jgi:outer membrane protein assembly factor BamB
LVDLPEPAELAKNWPRFRGPGGLGRSVYENLPTEWDIESGKQVVWSVEVPLPGNNSPVVWGDRIFLTGADKTNRVVYCFSTVDGQMLWNAQMPSTPGSRAKVPNTIKDTGYAAPTVATDGRAVYAIFGNGDVGAFDFDGKSLWARSLGVPENMYGHSISLLTDGLRLLVQFDQGEAKQRKSKVIALSIVDGKTIWEKRREVPNSWATGILVDFDGQRQWITTADPFAIAYDPVDGREIWRADCISGDHGISPVVVDNMVFVGNEYCDFQAIRLDGKGDVTDTHIEWVADTGLPEMVASPVVVDDMMFFVSTYGVLMAFDIKTGELLWEDELDGEFSSSPTLAGDLVYLFSKEDGHGWVVRFNRKGMKIVAENNLGQSIVTSPAMQPRRIYIRGENRLFGLGEKKQP